MTNDLISRSALLKKAIGVSEFDDGWERVLRAVPVLDIEMAEAVDAAPVVHGRWIDSNGAIRCSECLHTPLYDYHGRLKLSKACPTCGANMWKEREE